MTPRVLIVDDHTLLSQALGDALMNYGLTDVRIAGPHELGGEALIALTKAWRPSVVLLDIYLGGGEVATPLVPVLSAMGAVVVVLTASEDRTVWGQALEAGAAGVLSKSVALNDLVVSILRAAAGQPLLDDGDRAVLADEIDRLRKADEKRLGAFQRLTRREQQVLAALVDGRPAKQIARDLHVSIPTVRTHIRSVFDKLGVNSQRAAVTMALAAGWKPDAG
ncbi:MAG: response regulator transcription factor [Acidimicrobiia bacterium]